MAKSGFIYRLVLFLFLAVLSLGVVAPSVFNLNPEGKFPFKSKINLGLDLQGGLYMILGIDFVKVYRDEVISYGKKLESALVDAGIKAEIGDLNKADNDDPKLTVVLLEPAKKEEAKAKLKEYFRDALRLTGESSTSLEVGLTKLIKTQIQDQAVTKSIEVIRNRIDEFGVTEPEIVSQGQDRIVVQLPGVKDIDRAKELIGRTAKLEFKIVNDQISAETVRSWVERAKEKGIVYGKGGRFSEYLMKINDFLKAEMPKNHELVFEKKVNKFTNDIEEMNPYLVEVVAQVTGEDLQDATIQIDPEKNQPYVALTFKSSGAKRFELLTEHNVGKRLAVILDGNVHTAPNINERIGGGRASISLGAAGYDEALKQGKDIALVLRAGALPVQLDFEEQRIVGPSLGVDSIKQTKVASLISCLVLFLICIVYYRVSGAIAVVTLIFNGVFLFAALVAFGATLTLPGIAGIALTIGMAVDGNIIIYERIREEIKNGSSVRHAVDSGFETAFWTILDANITTAMAGICLLNFGTGPIRGFAVTLLIGLAITVYTAYFVSKLLFEIYMKKTNSQSISI